MSEKHSGVVADGQWRFLSSPEFQARCEQLRLEIEARYAELLSAAGVPERLMIRLRMRREYRRELRTFMPSPYSLW